MTWRAEHVWTLKEIVMTLQRTSEEDPFDCTSDRDEIDMDEIDMDEIEEVLEDIAGELWMTTGLTGGLRLVPLTKSLLWEKNRQMAKLQAENQRLRSEIYWLKAEGAEPHDYNGEFSEN